MKISRTLKVLILIVAVLLLSVFGIMLLRNLPGTEISQIIITPPDAELSPSIQERLFAVEGRNLFDADLSAIERSIEALPYVAEVKLKRKLPDTVVISIAYDDDIIVVEGGNKSYMVKDGRLVEISREDKNFCKNDNFCVIIPENYAQILIQYGLDNNFVEVMNLAGEIKNEFGLITNIKFDNNGSNSFGNMVLGIDDFNTVINVRENVAINRIRAAVALVVRNEGSNDLGFLNDGVRVYDLYSDAIVRRQ